MDSADLLRFGLYALTVLLGLVLLWWIRRTRAARSINEQRLRDARAAEAAAQTPVNRVTAVRGLPASESMAEALAGIRLPVHWQPEPPVEVASPLVLSTVKESSLDMARVLADELVRLGYNVTPTGNTSARAVRDANRISIEVESDDEGHTVSTRLTLTEAPRG